MTAIRPGRPDEAALISGIARRSKASWGYDDAFMEAIRPDLTFQPDDFENGWIFVLEVDGVVAGLYRLSGEAPEAYLSDLWLDPGVQGRGLGRRLWDHALATAASHGFTSVLLESDPNAEGFYAAMGATRVGERESQAAQGIEPGRMLPLMRIELTPSG